MREKIFLKFFETAEIARLDTTQYKAYENSLNIYRDIVNSINWAEEKGWMQGEVVGIEKGRIEGKIEGKIEIALQMLSENEPIDKIMRYTGLSMGQIEDLR